MDADELRWTYEQVAKQIEREDNLHQARLGSCTIVNLALLAAVASQIDFPAIGAKNLVIILGCSAVGYLITSGIRSAIANGETQLEYLREFFKKLDKERPDYLLRPFMFDEGPGRLSVPHPWASTTLVFQRMWIVLPALALLVFLLPSLMRFYHAGT